jgi:hypothetical protein
MTQRLQVLLEDEEFDELRAAAKAHRMTVADWVRQALRQARGAGSPYETGRKLALIREAARHAYPTAEMDDLLRVIERGYLEALPSDDASSPGAP